MTDFLRNLLQQVKDRHISKEEAMSRLKEYNRQLADGDGEAQGNDETGNQARHDSHAYELLTFSEQWQPAVLTDQPVRTLSRIICLASTASVQRQVRAFCGTDTQVIFIAASGAETDGHDQHVHVISTDQLSDYQQAFQAVAGQMAEADAVIDFWPLETPALRHDYRHTVQALQALAGSGLRVSRWLMAGQLADINHLTLERCYLESWLGFERSLAILLPQMPVTPVYFCQTTETETETAAETLPADLTPWLTKLWAECQSTHAHASLHVGSQRFVRAVRPTRLNTLNQQTVALREHGCYLISGGCGGLGMVFARHLAERCQARLILTGRSALTERHQQNIRTLEQLGAKVFYLQADICDRDAMLTGLRQATAQLGSVHGVLHAAGVENGLSLFEKDYAAMESVLAPKVQGTQVLDEVVETLMGERSEAPALDFVCYFSSTSAVLGDFGQCDYAIGNRFLMAYGQYRQQRVEQGLAHGKTLVINWPLWRDGGMGVADQEKAAFYLRSSAQRFLESDEGLAMFERILADTTGQHLVIAGEPARVQTFLERACQGSSQVPAKGKTQVVALNSSRPKPGRRDELRGLSVADCLDWDLKNEISQLLKVAKARLLDDENFSDFGFDSVSLAQCAANLSDYYGFEISPAVFFGYPTLQQFKDYLLTQYGPALEAFYETPSTSETPVRPASVHSLTAPATAAAIAPAAESDSEPQSLHALLTEPVAIIGMSGRFPGARDVNEFWQILADGRDVVTPLGNERFPWISLQELMAPGESLSIKGAYLEDVDEFDPLFFELSPVEAVDMDPRQRLLLQESWKALEDAGYGAGQLAGQNIAMYVGAEGGDYGLLQHDSQAAVTANHEAVMAARLSYFLNLSGANMAINTACSSGLVALHQACVALRNRECDAAVVAAVNLLTTPYPYLGMSRAGMLSASGTCHAFDRRADGLVPGEAVVAVVLRRLSRAEADADPVHALIRGSGVNYDGRTNGITAPSGVAQERLIKQVYDRFNLSPDEVQYVVAHGTGTPLGDPIEIQALSNVFRQSGTENGRCALTSTKTNVGHSFAASGLVSLAALIQAMQHQTIPASLHGEQQSDYIDWRSSPFYLNRESRPWQTPAGQQRLGAVSAFGMSGTNAHAIVGEYLPAARPVSASAPGYLLVLSAKTDDALGQMLANLHLHLSEHPADLAALSYTLLLGRQHFKYRCALVAQDLPQLLALLAQARQQESLPQIFRAEVARGFKPRNSLRDYGQALIAQAQVQRDQPAQYLETLGTLAEMHCQGYEFDWQNLFAVAERYRLHLPTYPFAREKYWVSAPAAVPATVVKEPSPVQSDIVDAPANVHVLCPHWQVEAVADNELMTVAEHWVVLCDPGSDRIGDDVSGLLSDQGRPEKINCLMLKADGQTTIEQWYEAAALELFGQLQTLMRSRPEAPILIQLVVFREALVADPDQLYAGLFGMLKSAQQEHPQIHCQLLELDPVTAANTPLLVQRLLENRQAMTEGPVRYRQDGTREILQWQPMAAATDVKSPWKSSAVYLITGGLGGIGLHFARDILTHSRDTTVLLTGRSQPDVSKLAALQALAINGNRVEYHVLDVCDAAAVQAFCASEAVGEGLTGIIHSAGLLRDSFIIQKHAGQFAQVLAPKVAGLVNLDLATQDMALDFIAVCASLTGVSGNVGQADYACANGFMDRYVHYRNELAQSGARQGVAIALDWPLWADGGMQVDAEIRAHVHQQTGLLPLPGAAGLQAFYQALADARRGGAQYMVLNVDPAHPAQQGAQVVAETTAAATPGTLATPGSAAQQEQTLRKLRGLFADVLKLAIDRIDDDEPFEKYGIDSMIITRLNQRLGNVFGELSKTLFYEYHTLAALADYLYRQHTAVCHEWIGAAPAPSAVSATVPAVLPPQPVPSIKPVNVASSAAYSQDPIAVIGVSGRYPGAANIRQYWRNLLEGRECISEIPAERWDWRSHFEADPAIAAQKGKSYSRWGGFISDFSSFDSLFFGISPREAINMDPQERLFMESCWHTLEHAGYTRSRLAERHRNRVGVFAGITKTGFELYGPLLWQAGEQVFPHTSFSSVANRLSYFMDLNGPSMPIDTMCSSSLTAIHQACEYLRRGDCDMALAGGVNLYLHPSTYVGLCAANMLSSDGHCRSFGLGGNGFVPGEGVGSVLLKPLSMAERDGDRILALIRASHINHGGKTSGYTVPNPNAQAELIRETVSRAGINARMISYIEAHGTGTELGDPIEVRGLTQAFAADTSDTGFCALGSVKSNIGHLEAAAGIAGLTKVILQLQHQTLVTSLHIREVNPNIDFSHSPFVLQNTSTAWQRPTIDGREYPRLAGLSSFGAGGANAHLIIEEYIQPQAVDYGLAVTAEDPAVIVLSARTADQLKDQARQLLAVIAAGEIPAAHLRALACTLQTAREPMRERLAMIVTGLEDLQQLLEAFIAGENPEGRIITGVMGGDATLTALHPRDEDARLLIDSWLEKKKYSRLLELWVRGLYVDWQRLYPQGSLPLVDLPLYPFARKRHWLPGAAQPPAPSAGIRPEQPELSPLLTFSEQWLPQALKSQQSSSVKTLVCFASSEAMQNAVVDCIQQHDQAVQLVFVSTGPVVSSNHNVPVYRLQDDDGDYRQVCRQIRRQFNQVDAIWYLWPLEDSQQVHAVNRIIWLLQGLIASGLEVSRIMLAGEYRLPGHITGQDSDYASLDFCYLDAWVGFERSLKLLCPQTAITGVYQRASATSDTVRQLSRLWRELHHEQPQSVVYDGDIRKISQVQPLALPVSADAVAVGLRQGGCYLITGGLGGLGLILAEYLARRYGANLILTGRAALDAARQSRLQDLQLWGGRVHYVQGNVSDHETMHAGLAAALAEFGQINGVLHVAGVETGLSLAEKDFATMASVLNPKIDGTVILDHQVHSLLTAAGVQQKLDFVCLFSSTAAVLGDFGQCDYAIGNRFQMAYGRYRQHLVQRGKRHGRTLVINWPLWRDGGMGKRSADNNDMYLRSSGQRYLERDEALALFEQLLQQPETQTLVIAGQRDRACQFLGIDADVNVPVKHSQPPAAVKPAVATRTTPVAPTTMDIPLAEHVEATLKQQIQQLLGLPLEEIGRDQNLADFGFDSISLTELARLVSAHYRIEFSPAVFFGYPTVAQVRDYLLQRHADALSHADQAVKDSKGAETLVEDRRHTPAVVAAVTPAAFDSATTAIPEAVNMMAIADREPGQQPASLREPIAIIGMSGRFPQARDIDEMWQILAEGREAVTLAPAERFQWQAISDAESREQLSRQRFGAVPGVAEFDPLFFEISPREAIGMDPRQRLLMQESWRALEDAGFGERHLRKQKIGVFVGAESGDYGFLRDSDLADSTGITANHEAMLAARLSYFLNLSGPNMTLNTACSSSLVAAHQACTSLRVGECDSAVVAGVNLMTTPIGLISMNLAGMLSPQGKCLAFDQNANGLVPGEAVVALVLKRLSAAKADGDPIYAAITASGINYDGRTQGITAPSGKAQAELLDAVYAQFDIDVSNIDYVVTHGTGTRLGDPIEVNALRDVFRQHEVEPGHCALTSVKTNFGHSFAASGLVSLVALVQALRHETIPASLHCQAENPLVAWEDSPLYVNKTARPWPARAGQVRLGAVSAFGMSGTNAHMVVSSIDADIPVQAEPQPYYLLPLSAKTESALTARVEAMLALFEQSATGLSLDSVSYTLLEGRQHFKHRCVIVAASLQEACERWRQLLNGESMAGVFSGQLGREFNGQAALQRYGEQLIHDSHRLTGQPQKYRETLNALADLYCQGYALDWPELFDLTAVKRLHLPTYPFARDHYWSAGNIGSGETSASQPVTSAQTGKMLLKPYWQNAEVAKGVDYAGQTLRILCEPKPETEAELRSEMNLILQHHSSSIEERYRSYAGQLLEQIKTLLQSKPSEPVLVQIVVFRNARILTDDAQMFAGLFGILITAHHENPRVIGQLIEMDDATDAATVISRLADNGRTLQPLRVRYHGYQRQILNWREMISAEGSTTEIRQWQDEGVYVITGGVGGIGLVIARDILNGSRHARVLLIGRSALDEQKQARLQSLQSLGGRASYHQIDVADEASLATLAEEIKTRYTRIEGIFHCAGVIQDNYIINKPCDELEAVLAPKVAGLLNLDRLTEDMDIGFLLLFSSISAALGNAGQADYAIANAFMDNFARYRSRLVEAGQRSGRTISVNWPLWREGGMHIDQQSELEMARRTGLVALRNETGLQAIWEILNYRDDEGEVYQWMVLEGELERLRAQMAVMPARTAVETVKPALQSAQQTPQTAQAEADVYAAALPKLIALFADVARMKLVDIDADEELLRYGIDSLMITQLNRALGEVFPGLSKTLFYEYQTLAQLGRYLSDEYRDICLSWCGVTSAALTTTAPQAEVQPVNASIAATVIQQPRAVAQAHEAIAIIGISGRYPQADSLEQYWQNLSSGRDCIRDVPADRWALEGFFVENPKTAVSNGKSYSKWGGFIEGFAEFDPLFFGISPLESTNMDPQERLFLQSAWHTFEHAGYTREILRESCQGRVGVFAGITKTGFDLYGPGLWQDGEKVLPRTSFSSVANRLSYLMDLHGPSMPIDTMCSSSLTAIHEACEHLHRGNCDMAIAGGVNLYLHPACYIELCSTKMLSTDGRCKSFGAGGNGFVPGEGVGTVLLKPLRRAEQDGDNILALIRGSSINHGGKTNGYTVPNPVAQASLIKAAMQQAGVKPEEISYIEAHGTGTELGDPIEVTGLTQAFIGTASRDRQLPQRRCALGSVKSNIGHLEAAAGIAGLTKIVLQMQHGQLVPSLHAETLNPNIDFDQTPFVLQRSLSEWTRPQQVRDGEIHELPRMAGISSFGAGGSNAHVIIEEYRPSQPPAVTALAGAIIFPLSARNEERLLAYARQWLNWLQGDGADVNPADMMFTLQTGREAMEERLGIVAASMSELISKLDAFCAGQNTVDGVYRGNEKQQREALALFGSQNDVREAMDKWLARQQFEQMLALWVKGIKVNWQQLYRDRPQPRRINLPVYPFARRHYWLPLKASLKASKPQSLVAVAQLHPLLQRNASTLSQQRFESHFSGEEFFLHDHRVNGQRFMPGVAYLEMARAAVAHSVSIDQPHFVQLNQTVWLRPLIVDRLSQVSVTIEPKDNGRLRYQVSSQDGQGGEIVHCQGRACLMPAIQPITLDIAALRQQCRHHQVSSTDLYGVYQSLGIEYGPAHQAVTEVLIGDELAVAALRLPTVVAADAGNYVLHPSLMDSALQATITLLLSPARQQAGQPGAMKPALPFALDEICIYGRCSAVMWAVIRSQPGSTDKGVQKIDIDVCDEQGVVVAHLKGYAGRNLESEATDTNAAAAVSTALMSVPVWEARTTAQLALDPQYGQTGQQRALIVCDPASPAVSLASSFAHADIIDPTGLTLAELTDQLRTFGDIEHVLWVASPCPVADVADDALIRTQNHNLLCCFRTIKALLALRYGSRALRWTVLTFGAQQVYPADVIDAAQAGLHGLIGAMAKEFTKWQVRLLDLPQFLATALEHWPMDTLWQLRADPQGDALAYRFASDEVQPGRQGEWHQQMLLPYAPAATAATVSAWRDGGVYVVIGGAGGIGHVWSEYMIRHHRARIVWIGRRPLNADIQAQLDQLSQFGEAPTYISADATDRASLEQAYQQIRDRFGAVHGLIHAAIVLKDQALANMEEQRLHASLSAKVDTSVRMAQVFQPENPDFVLFFSSTQSFSKAAGQSNYSSGCVFEDAFARQLATHWSCPVKVMNWGFWGSVGIVASEEYRQRMRKVGLESIEPEDAMPALQTLLTAPVDQVTFVKVSQAVVQQTPALVQPQLLAYPPEQVSIIDSLNNRPLEVGEAPEVEAAVRDMGAVEPLLYRILRTQLLATGYFHEGVLNWPEVRPKLPKLYPQWFAHSLQLLTEQGLMQRQGDQWQVFADDDDPWQQWAEMKPEWNRNPALKAQIALVETTLAALPDILTGKRLATEVMFPKSSMALVENIYRNNPVADLFNRILVDSLVNCLQSYLDKGVRQFRLLEVGAGTGGTSALVFEALKPYREYIAEYCYTDISKAFLLHAEKTYGPANPYLRYKLFDAIRSPAEQGIQPGCYDIVIATNVLHATRNMRQTLRNVKAVLKHSGLLMLNEMSANPIFSHLTFGLLEGWWMYEDPALRLPGSPALSTASWQTVLEHEGFRSPCFPAEPCHLLGQQIVIAESDGQIRQMVSPSADVKSDRTING
ncbi:SDR family NAD(P)-dependent oxidoreductase [Gynuella sunshinyii]|uniref:Polyketide synthase modules-related protein n=1 Tax=Gynuella sunshinyii YC6258 TaxID=1445510 RepID=A0A0C5V8K3_9GAMM|nr:SDR family NAD(P)-dependent oxidoreductase [Gynuella sunshinyii]AJQ95705.1 polyketide synthase modules-related protein [Gynuella sunshinyii YC6258]